MICEHYVQKYSLCLYLYVYLIFVYVNNVTVQLPINVCLLYTGRNKYIQYNFSTEAYVKVNNLYTPWFDYTYEVKQGESLSPILFNIFIDDLATKLIDQKLGVDIDGTNYCILMYADDVVLMAESANDLQKMLDTVYTWMTKWYIILNLKKSKYVHFRPKTFDKTNYKFHINNVSLEVAESY